MQDPEIGKVVMNRYKLVDHLGEGNFGSVYRAESIDGLKKQFAVKVINPYKEKEHKAKEQGTKGLKEIIDSLQNEPKIIQQLHSRHVLSVYEPGDNGKKGTEARFYVVMNLCAGGSMLKYNTEMKDNQKIEFHYFRDKKMIAGTLVSEDMMRLYMRQIASVFHYYNHVEVKHLIHRDIKLDNIFIDGDNAVIGDFGFASVGIRKHRQLCGTPGYNAPEIAKGMEYDCKVDVFSLGMTFYFLAYKIYYADTYIDQNRCIIKPNARYGRNMSFPLLPEMSDEFKELLRNMTEVDPSDRYNWEQVMNSSFILDRLQPPRWRARYGLFEYEFDLEAFNFFSHIGTQLDLSLSLLAEMANQLISFNSRDEVQAKICERLRFLKALFAKKSQIFARMALSVLESRTPVNDMTGLDNYLQFQGVQMTAKLKTFESHFGIHSKEGSLYSIAENIGLECHLENIKKLMSDNDGRYLSQLEYQVEECIGRVTRLSRLLPSVASLNMIIFKCILLNNHQKHTPVRNLGKKDQELFDWTHFKSMLNFATEQNPKKKELFEEFYGRLLKKAENYQ